MLISCTTSVSSTMSASPDWSSASSLYCNESVNDTAAWDGWACDQNSTTVSNCCDDRSSIANMIDLELELMPGHDSIRQLHCCHEVVTARTNAIKWIYKVHAVYNFRPETAYLSVNYLDRFLISRALPQGKGWPWQLLAVACLSLAAKMEETRVPHLLDLQIMGPKFIFKPKTVQRMELLVMASLKWRLRAVTPFDFLDYFYTKLQCLDTKFDHFSFFCSRASALILTTCRVTAFLDFTPSTIAAAAVLLEAGQDVVDHKTACFHENMNNEMVKKCQQLLKEHLTKMCQPPYNEKQIHLQSPACPVGVVHAGCDCKRFLSMTHGQAETELPSEC